jgi:hypothetical protein
MGMDKGSQTRRTRNGPARRSVDRERNDRAQRSGYGSGHREIRNHDRLRNARLPCRDHQRLVLRSAARQQEPPSKANEGNVTFSYGTTYLRIQVIFSSRG